MASTRRKKTVTPPPSHTEAAGDLSAPAVPEVVPLRLSIEPKGTAPKFYVNHAEVNTTPFEMAITFARLPPRFDADEAERLRKGETITLPSEVQILLPISFVPALISAMAGQKADYDKMTSSRSLEVNERKSDE